METGENKDVTRFCPRCDEVLIPHGKARCDDCEFISLTHPGWENNFLLRLIAWNYKNKKAS